MSNIALLKNGLRTSLLDSLYYQIQGKQIRYYFCLGQSAPWTDDTIPPIPTDSPSYEQYTRQSIQIAKLIDPSNISLVVRRINWVYGTAYDFYDDQFSIGLTGASTLKDANFYVMTSDYNVYKCLGNNNNRQSFIQPSGTDPRPFTTSDNYTWKFMYSINPAVVSKFVTNSYIPVANPLSNDYYRKGSINNVSIQSIGSGFTTAPSLIVTGDGYLASNPYYVTAISLSTPGSGYTSTPNVTIDPPYSNYINWSSGAYVYLGQIVKYSINYYTVSLAGTLSSVPPTHTMGSVGGSLSSNATLTYSATGANAFASINGTAIGSVYVTNPGAGYVGSPAVSFVGSSTTAAAGTGNVLSGTISSVNITNVGAGYNAIPTVVFAEPYPTNTAFSASLAVTAGTIISYINNGVKSYYNVVTTGTLGTIAPTFLVGTQPSGTTSLQYFGTLAQGIAVLGFVTSVTLTGYINFINIVNPGTGYSQLTTSVSVVSTNGTGSGAILVPVVSGGQIVGINVVSQGQGYVQGFTNVVITGGGTGATATANLSYSYGYTYVPNTVVSAPNSFAPMTGSVSTTTKVYAYSAAPSGTVGLIGTVASKANAQAISAQINPYGTVASATSSTVKSNAIITATVDPIAGAINGINIINGGIGYTTATILVVGSGTGAALTPLIDFGNLLSSQTDSQILAVPGTISGGVILNPGIGYTYNVVSITGDGTGATAVGNIINGQLDSIIITNPGTGYTYANITFSGDGVGATARLIVSPPQGHGFNPEYELYALGLGFFTPFSSEANQGILSTNDYRQISIVRDPFKYNQNVITQDALISACFSVKIKANPAITILQDDIFYDSNTLSSFRVVELSSDQTTLLLQSINSDVLTIGDSIQIVKSGITYQFGILSVIYPSFNKYSGSLIFINNLSPFKYSPQELISLRTIIELD